MKSGEEPRLPQFHDPMSWMERLHYALVLAIVSAAAMNLVLMIGSADGIDLFPKAVIDFVFSPLQMGVLYAAAFAVAPWVEERVPISRRRRR